MHAHCTQSIGTVADHYHQALSLGNVTGHCRWTLSLYTDGGSLAELTAPCWLFQARYVINRSTAYRFLVTHRHMEVTETLGNLLGSY